MLTPLTRTPAHPHTHSPAHPVTRTPAHPHTHSPAPTSAHSITLMINKTAAQNTIGKPLTICSAGRLIIE